MSCWQPNLYSLITVGSELEVETEEQGGYINITSATLIGKVAIPAQHGNSRDELIIRQTCVKAAAQHQQAMAIAGHKVLVSMAEFGRTYRAFKNLVIKDEDPK